MASCGAALDLPDNVPLAGSWSDKVTVTSLSMGGEAMSEEDLPADFPKPSQKKICGEPKLRTREEIRDAADVDALKHCRLGDVYRNGNHISMSSTCNLPDNGSGEMEMTVDLAAVESADTVTLDLTMNANATAGDGEMQTMEVSYRRELTRLGDC